MRRELQRRAARRPSLLAVDGASAALAKPYLGTVPAYASGLVFERGRRAPCAISTGSS